MQILCRPISCKIRFIYVAKGGETGQWEKPHRPVSSPFLTLSLCRFKFVCIFPSTVEVLIYRALLRCPNNMPVAISGHLSKPTRVLAFHADYHVSDYLPFKDATMRAYAYVIMHTHIHIYADAHKYT